MLIDQFQKRSNRFFVEIVNSLCAIRFYFYKSAYFKPLQMVRHQTLLIVKFFGNGRRAIWPTKEKVNNIPSHLISEGFKKELMRSIK